MWCICAILWWVVCFGILWNLFKCQKLVVVCYWYSAWRRERAARRMGNKPVTMVTERAGRLAAWDGCARRWWRVAPGGRAESARWWRCSDGSAGAWRLAVCDARQAVWTQCLLGDVRCAPSGFGSVMVREERFLHSFRWCSWCEALAGVPVTSVTRIGVARDNSRL